MKDKYEFILELLETGKLTPAQKERVLKLSIFETKKDGKTKETELIKRIEEIEIKLERDRNDRVEISVFNTKKHKPKDTYELLNYFSSTDGGMKNLTHSFNFGFIAYEDLLKKCKAEFEQGRNKYSNVPEALLTRIQDFAFSESPNWYILRGDKKIEKKMGWSEPTFVKWYKENHTHPANDAYYNSEMVVPFKETIQVRSDIGNLIKIINELSDMVFQKDIKLVIKEAVHTAQFYTDVDRLGLAIFHIFNAIKQASSKNFCDEVEIDFEIKDAVKIIKIVHIDSIPTKSVNDFDFLGGDLGSVRNNLWSLCNYDILAKFKEGEYRKVILSDKPTEIEKYETTGKWLGKNYKTDEKIKGFTHVLKFY